MAFLDETGLAHFWNQILARLNKFVPAETGKGLSSNDYTTEEKEKLAGVESGANKTTVDSSLSSASTNPVQNKIINTKFDSIQASIDSKVDKVTGKGLSTNDLTATLKSNYNAAYTHSQQAHAPADAEKNIIVGVQKNGTDLTVNATTRKVNITVPTKTSELTNDSSFVTTTDLDAKADAPFKPEGKSYLTFSSPNSFTLKVNDTTKHWDGTLEYFASDRTWTIWNGTTTLSSVNNDGEYVLYLRGAGNTKITGQGTDYRWVLTGSSIACTGNIENLLDYATVKSGEHPTIAECCCYYMFYKCTSLTQAPALPATTLANNCYQSMFNGCTSLTQAPALPATTLTSGCYMSMFDSCTSLTQAPALPATTLANDCYYHMFYDCTSLTQAPALPATALADRCYYSMFCNCTSLTQAPALPATTLADRCYCNMFNGCASLTQVFALPATTLAYYCYSNMFNGCASLTKVPTLPATTLAEGCYNYMFIDCTSLKLSSTQTGEYTQEYCIPSSGTGTTVNSALNSMFGSTGGTFTGTPKINTTYYLSTNNMVVRETEVATLNGYVGSMIRSAYTYGTEDLVAGTSELATGTLYFVYE